MSNSVFKAIILGAVTASSCHSSISYGHPSGSPEMGHVILLATLRSCETNYPDMQPSLSSAREAWRKRFTQYVGLIENNPKAQVLIEKFLEDAKRRDEKPERSICEQLVGGLTTGHPELLFE